MNLLKVRRQIGAFRFPRRWRFQTEAIEDENSIFPILLKLEWILLIFTGMIGLLHAFLFPLSEVVFLSSIVILSAIAFSVMRFWRFPQKLPYKILYTALEFAILLLPTMLDARLNLIPPLILIIVIRSCQMFSLPGRLMIAVLAFSTFWMSSLWRNPIPPVLLKASGVNQVIQDLPSLANFTLRMTALSSFGLALVFILLLINALLEERQSRTKLIAAHEQLRQYALRIEDQSALQERNRIAREIHDSLGHTLTAQSIQLDGALLLLKSDIGKASTFLQTSKQLCTQALQEVRQSVMTLRTDPLQGQPLEIAIAALVDEFRATTAISTHCTMQITALPSQTNAAVYRILQEALTNIARHSSATHAMIRVFEQEQKLYLVVKDNGKGFNPTQNSTGFGLQSMRERTAAIGGRFTLLSQPGEGCLITVQLSLPQLVP